MLLKGLQRFLLIPIEIMITNFARNINQQQNSGPPALQSEVGAVDPFDKLQFSVSYESIM